MLTKRSDRAVIIQARMSSQRFPGKMMADLSGMPLFEYVYRRCARSLADNVLVATSDDKSDDPIYERCQKEGIPIFRGSLQNVLNRYIQAAQKIGSQYIIRVCADSPFVDISVFDSFLDKLSSRGLDYVGFNRQDCISGFISEAIKLDALKLVADRSKDADVQEHVTKYILDHPDEFKIDIIKQGLSFKLAGNIRLTIDYPQDILMANRILMELKDKISFTPEEILSAASNATERSNKGSHGQRFCL